MPHDRLLRSLCGALHPNLLIFVYRLNAASHDNARWCIVWRSRTVRRHGPFACTKNLHHRNFRNLESFEPSRRPGRRKHVVTPLRHLSDNPCQVSYSFILLSFDCPVDFSEPKLSCSPTSHPIYTPREILYHTHLSVIKCIHVFHSSSECIFADIPRYSYHVPRFFSSII